MMTLTLAVSVLSQTLVVILSYYRYPRNRRWAFETLLDLFVLIQIFVCSMMHGQAMRAYDSGMVHYTGYGSTRIIVFIVLVLISTIVIMHSRKPWPFLTVAATSLLLPVTEQLTGGAFAYLYTGAVLFWLVRSIKMNLIRAGEMRSNISSLSIINAIDSLNTGVMFCEDDGFVLLSNIQMQRLMIAITGKAYQNGRRFYGLLTLGSIEPGCEITWFEGQNVCLLPDGSAWIFSVTELKIGRKKYTQITATDVTERWKLTAELQPQNDALIKIQEELSDTIANLHILSRERETQRAKMRAHDVLGERLTYMLHTIRGDKKPDEPLLRSLAQGLIDELKAAGCDPAPQDELDILKQTFQAIGVEIIVDGSLPEDIVIGQLFADISREAITNAVRHGFATQINIHMDNTNGDHHLTITDNGHPPGAFKAGGGISGMRKKVEPFSGTLNIAIEPRFILTVIIPEIQLASLGESDGSVDSR